jgi:hypothetical protein
MVHAGFRDRTVKSLDIGADLKSMFENSIADAPLAHLPIINPDYVV